MSGHLGVIGSVRKGLRLRLVVWSDGRFGLPLDRDRGRINLLDVDQVVRVHT